MTIPKEASSELPHPPWVVYKVILPAKLLSIKGDKLTLFASLPWYSYCTLTHGEIIAPEANPLWHLLQQMVKPFMTTETAQ